MSGEYKTKNTSLTKFYMVINWTSDIVPVDLMPGVDYVFDGSDVTLATVLHSGMIFGTHDGVMDLTLASGADVGVDLKVGDVIDAFFTLGLGGPWRGIAANGDPVFGTITEEQKMPFDGRRFLSDPTTIVVSGGTTAGATSVTPIGPDLNDIVQGRNYIKSLTVEDYQGPAIGGGVFAFSLASEGDYITAGTGGESTLGLLTGSMDGSSLVLVISLATTDTNTLETTPPNTPLHYVYECTLTVGGGTYSVLMGGATIVRKVAA